MRATACRPVAGTDDVLFLHETEGNPEELFEGFAVAVVGEEDEEGLEVRAPSGPFGRACLSEGGTVRLWANEALLAWPAGLN